MLPENIHTWIGKEDTEFDIATTSTLTRLAALLDHTRPPWPPETVPALGHWLYALGAPPQSELANDGHLKLGQFLPPLPLPRRMWAAGEVEFVSPIKVGASLRRRSLIKSIEHKVGRSGDLVFVTLQHEIYASAKLAISERQHLVYRAKPTAEETKQPAEPRPVTPLPSPDWERKICPDPLLLFRFSALTFNTHRIHYDREYAVRVEGYPGLVVHGPLLATLLMDLFLLNQPARTVTRFSFKAHEPLFDLQPFTIAGVDRGGSADLWAIRPDQRIAMRAELTYT
jgi:3-methylfumaryl-CoA hydratase